MKLTISKDIQCNKYSVLIKFSEYGSTTLTPEEEQELLDDYCLKFKLSDIDFKGNYQVVEGKVEANVGGEEVTLSVPNKSIGINSDLEVGYTIFSNDVNQSEIKPTHLNNVDLVCKAKIQLFIDKVTSEINTLIENAQKNFNDNYQDPETVIVG